MIFLFNIKMETHWVNLGWHARVGNIILKKTKWKVQSSINSILKDESDKKKIALN